MQTPPRKKKHGGGGGARERPTATKPPTHAKKAAKPPSQTAPRTGPARAPEDHPAKRQQHQTGSSGPPEEGTPRTRRHTPRWGGKKTKNTRRCSRNERGRRDGHRETQDWDTQRPTPQSHDTTRHDAEKNTKGEGGGPSTHAHTAHPKRERRSTGGARTQPRTLQHLNQERWDAGQNPSPTAKTANPNREKKGATSTRTQTHPTKTPAKGDGLTGTQTQAQPGPIHRRQTKIGNPVPIARALRQPLPCR